MKRSNESIIEQIASGEFDETDLLEFVTSNDFGIALAVAESEYTTASILKIASLDVDDRIRFAVVQNANISNETLIKLSEDKNEMISNAAKERLERSKE